MRIISKIMTVIIASLVVFSCETRGPGPCCDNVPDEKVEISQKNDEVVENEVPTISTDGAYLTENQETFEPELVVVVDYNRGNFFVRGNIPIIDNKFAYDELEKTIRERLSAKGLSLSTDFLLVDISLLSAPDELRFTAIEKEWYRKNPSLGCYWSHPLYGIQDSPIGLSREVRREEIAQHKVKQLRIFLKNLRTMVTTRCEREVVLYAHCRAGTDRVGEIAACYMMQYGGYSYDQVMAENRKIAGGEIHVGTQNAIAWYAFYLRDTKGVTTIGKIEGQ